MADNLKYGQFTDLFLEIQPETGHDEDYYAQPFGYFKGDRDIPGAKYRVGFRVITKPVVLEDEVHFHREEQYYIFMGAKIPDVFDFDAEIEFWLGESPDDMEKVIITKPSIIRVPANMWHGPVKFLRVDKPVFLQDPLFSGKPGAVKKRGDADGKDFYMFDGREY